MPSALWSRVPAAIAAVPGLALAGASAVAAVARGDKPLHPTGVMGQGTLTLSGPGTLDLPLAPDGEVAVTARFSWAVGTGPDRPDIHGLALAFDTAQGRVDWLLASTGSGQAGRFLLHTRSPGSFGTLTTLLPMRTPRGPLLVRAEPVQHSGATPPSEFAVSAALGLGDWAPAGTLRIAWSDADDPAMHFDPIQHAATGATPYGWVRTLREPAYAAARLFGPRSPR